MKTKHSDLNGSCHSTDLIYAQFFGECFYDLLLFCIYFNCAIFWKELSCVLKILLQFPSIFGWLNMDCLIIFSAFKREICDLYLGAGVPS